MIDIRTLIAIVLIIIAVVYLIAMWVASFAPPKARHISDYTKIDEEDFDDE